MLQRLDPLFRVMHQVSQTCAAWWQRGWVRLVVSAGLLWWLAASVDWREISVLLRQTTWSWLALVLCLQAGNRFLGAVKWRVLLRAKGFSHSFGDVLRVIWMSNFLGTMLPASVGGDSIRMWTMARRSDRPADAVSTVAVERLTGLMALALVAMLGACWSAARWGDQTLLVGLSLPVAMILVMLALLWTARGERLLSWILSHFHRFPGHRFLISVLSAVHMFRHDPRPVLQSTAVSCLVQLNRVATTYVLARALGIPLGFDHAMALVPPALLVTMLPISIGGLGVQEGAFVLLLSLVGISRSAAFGLSILNRLAVIVSNLPGAVMLMLEGRAREGAAAAVETNGHEAPRRIRALWLADKLGYGESLNGGGRYYLNTLPSLRDVQATAMVFRIDDPLLGLFHAQGVPLQALRHHPLDARVLWRLTRLIRSERIDVLQVQGFEASVLGRLAGWLTGTPVIVRQGDSVPGPRMFRTVDRLLTGLTTRTIAVSGAVREFCIRVRRLNPERIITLPNAVSAIRFRTDAELRVCRQRLDIPGPGRLIGSITRFHPIKGVQHVIDAMPAVLQAVPDAYLVLWGEGPEHDALAAQAQRLGVAGHVRFAGYWTDAAEWLRGLECFVLPSVSEGSPNAILEAMAAGRPIVATRVGGVPELLRDGHDGLLVPPADADALARAIVRVLQEPALAQQLGHTAQATSHRYSIDWHVGELRRIYLEVTA